MYTLKDVSIRGLWSARSAEIAFHDDVNFLIGPNGSGKTTIVDIIVATLTASRRALYRLPFESCRISLHEPGTMKTGTLQVDKEKSEAGTTIVYTISSPPSEDRRFVLAEPTLRYSPLREKLSARNRDKSLSDEISELVDVRWVSVSRAAVPKSVEKDYETTVDVKLDEVREGFVRYAGRLSNRSSRAVSSVIETMFESLVLRPDFSLASTAIGGDLQKEKNTIVNMFETLSWLESERYESQIDDLFQVLQAATDRGRSGSFSPDEIGAIFALARLQTLENQWSKVQERQSRILKPLDQFFSLLNNLFTGKRLEKNESNEITATLSNGDKLDLKHLSSGEKQMIILLGEALLQQGKPSVYLADEPELSLHIEWQESLVSSVRELNPKSQLIFATHSPDIVSVYEDRTVKVNEVIR